MAAMVGDCYWGGLISPVEAVDVLSDAAHIERGEAARLLLDVPAPPRRDDPREGDGRWTS